MFFFSRIRCYRPVRGLDRERDRSLIQPISLIIFTARNLIPKHGASGPKLGLSIQTCHQSDPLCQNWSSTGLLVQLEFIYLLSMVLKTMGKSSL